MNVAARLIVLAAGAMLLAACGSKAHDGPDVARRDAALKAGLKYFESRNFDKARVEFRNAVQADPKSAEALYQSGRVAERLGEFREAGTFYKAAVEVDPQHARARADLARAHLFGGLPEQALEIVQAGIAQAPDDVNLLTVRGAVRAALRDVPGAFQDAERAVALDARNEQAVLLLAGLYDTNARSDRARALLEKAVVDHPRSRDVRLALASLYASLELPAEAEKQLRTLMEFEPDDAAHPLALARLLVAGKRVDAAEQVMQEAIERFPAERDLRRALVDLLVSTRGPEAAERQLRAFAQAAPADAESTFALAQFFVGQGRQGDAEKTYREVIAREGTKSAGLVARSRLASMLVARGDTNGARRLVEEVLAVNPREGEALFVRGNLALAAGDPKATIADMRVIIRDQPDAAGALRILGRAHGANGEPELAMETLRRAVEADPRDIDARLELAQVMIDNGRASQARPILEIVMRLRPNDAAAYDLAFKAAVATRDMAAARAAAEGLGKAQPGSALASFYRGVVLEAEGRTGEAEAAYREALRINGLAVEPARALANLLVNTGRVPAALAVYDDVAAADPRAVDALLAKGELLLRQRRAPEAEKTFRAALQRAPASWLAYRGLAVSLGARGDVAGAESVLAEGIGKVDQRQVLRADLAELYVRSNRLDRALALYDDIVKEAPQLDVAKSRLAMLLATHRADAASLERAAALTAGFEKSGRADLMEAYGFVKLKRGDANGAALALQRALDLAPDSPSIIYHLGLAQLQSGALDAGRTTLGRIVSRGPSTPLYADAKAAIERAQADL